MEASMTGNEWQRENPPLSDAPRLILGEPEGKAFWPKGKESAYRARDGRFSRISNVRAYAEESGWIDGSGTDLLYVSSGNDPRPLFALAAEGLGKCGIEASDTPTFFVYVDHSHPERSSEPNLRDPEPDSEEIHLEESEEVQVAGFPAHLLFLTLSPEVGDDRRVAVLRIKANNEEVGNLAEAEGWVPRWFVGICDGCNGYGGQIEDPRLRGEDGLHLRCENQVAEGFHSIPLNLGVRYWLTDHLRSGTQPLEVSETTTLPTGEGLRLIRHWTEWPDSGFFGDPSLYEVITEEVNR
jgi:hypothetical protein